MGQRRRHRRELARQRALEGVPASTSDMGAPATPVEEVPIAEAMPAVVGARTGWLARLSSLGGTGVGATAGFVVGGPLGAAVGGGFGALVDWARR